MKFLTLLTVPIVLLFLLIVVPVGINYIFVNGIIFKATDILGFYGSVLSSGIAALISYWTIQFTKKQIKRQAYVEREKDKWNKIEEKIAEVLTKINPLNIVLITMMEDLSDYTETMDRINKYSLDCKIAADCLTPYLSREEDFPKIKELIDTIHADGELFYQASEDLGNQYQKISILKAGEMAADLLKNEKRYPGILSPESVFRNTIIAQEAEGLTREAILSDISRAKIRLKELYENEYRSLLGLKGSQFKVVMDDLENKSFKILDM